MLNKCSQPKVSVVIPAFNEEGFLSATLISLLNQDRDDFEVIVVDNNSSDRTSQIAYQFGAKVVFEPQQGVGFARQAGFEVAQAPIIASTDADTIVPSNWVSYIVKEFGNQPSMVILGGRICLYSGPFLARFTSHWLQFPFCLLDRILSGAWTMAGSNFAIRQETFTKIGGFTVSLTRGEDVDIALRAQKIGQGKLGRKLCVKTSGRRFRHGLSLGLLSYAPYWFCRVLFNKNKFLKLSAVRQETSLWCKFKILPLSLAITCLLAFFYTNNAFIAKVRAKEARSTKIKIEHGLTYLKQGGSKINKSFHQEFKKGFKEFKRLRYGNKRTS